MARTLEQLQLQYNKKATAERRGGPGGPRIQGGGKMKNSRATIARMLGYLKPFKFRLIGVFACMLISTVTTLLGSYMTAPAINRLYVFVTGEELNMSGPEKIADRVLSSLSGPVSASMSKNDVISFIISVSTVIAIVFGLNIITTYLQSRLMLSVSQGSIENIRNDLFTKLQRLPVRYFDSNPTGEIMSRFTNDIDNIDVMINNSLTQLFSGSVQLIGTFVFMITTNWILTLITIVFIPIFALGGGAIAKLSSKYYSGQQAALGAVNGYTEETVTGQKVIKVFNHEGTCVKEFDELNDDMRDKQFRAQFWGGVMGPIMGNTSQISYAVTIGIGGILMIFGRLTPGGLTLFAQYSRQFSMPINMITQQMATLFAALAGAERVFEVMDTAPEPQDMPIASTKPVSYTHLTLPTSDLV